MPGEGSIFQRAQDGRWVAALKIGPRGQSRKWVRYLPLRENRKGERHCRKAALKLLDELIEDVQQGRADRGARPVSPTLGDYLGRWHSVYATKVGASQATNALSLIKHHIVPALGPVDIARLTAHDVDRFLAGLSLSSQSKRHAYNVLAKALDTAVRDELVPRNVARLVDAPGVTKVERQPWSLPEAATFLESARQDRYFAAYLLAIVPGIRQGEILGLAWADVDLDALEIRVDRQLQRRAGEYVRVPTKGRHGSSRSIAPGVADVLREHRRTQLAERLAAKRPTQDGLVFLTPKGLPVNGSWLTHHFEALSRGCAAECGARHVHRKGVRVIPFHSLRHLSGTLMALLQVNPRVAQLQLGHRNVSTTLGSYTHVTDEQQADAAAKVAALLGLGKLA